MSTMGVETEDSEPKMIVGQSAIQYAQTNGIELPRMVLKTGLDDMTDKPFEQWQPALQVTSRTEGINFYLNIISAKVGLDTGTFVFNGQKVVVATATQIEATERQTINTMMMYRQVLDRPESNGDGRVGVIHDIAYIINAMEVINGDILPSEFGNYELYADFGDPFSNKEEDKLFELQLANQGYMSKARFLIRHLGMTEEEAKKMVQEAVEERNSNEPEGSRLFGEE